MSLEKLRQLPEFQNASDAEILSAVSKTARVPLQDVASVFGSDTGGKWGNRASASVDNYQAGLYGVGEAVTSGTPLEGFFRSRRQANEAEADLARANARAQGAVMSYKDANSVGDYADWVGGLAVDSVPYIGEALLGGVAGRALLTGGKTALGLSRSAAGTVGGVVASYPSAVGDILGSQRDEIERTGTGSVDLASAAAGGVPYAALNALGLTGAASRAGGLRRAGVDLLDNMSGARGALARTGVAFAKNAVEEGISETGQEVINQGLGRMAVNPDQTLFNPEANERYLDSFIGGAALGGVVGGAAGGWRRSEGYQPTVRPQVPGLGEAIGEPPAIQAGAQAVQEVLQANEQAQADRAAQAELEAAARAQAALEAQVPPTPEEIAKERAKAGAQALVQQAGEIVKAEGLVKVRGAQELVINMLKAGDAVTPEVAGEVIGFLQAGSVPLARTTLTNAISQAKKAQADAQRAAQKEAAAAAKEQEVARLRGEQADRIAKADADQKAADIARLQQRAAANTRPATAQGETANVPSPAQPGTQTSQAQSAQGAQEVAVSQQANTVAGINPDKTITVGRKGREVTVSAQELADKITGASLTEKRRIARAMGWDVTENPTTGAPMLVELEAPMSFADIARMEERETGSALSRQAIQQTLQKFGISPDAIDRATASDWGNTTVSDAELGIGALDEGGRDTSGMRVETTASKAMGQGLVNDRNVTETAAQRDLRKRADQLLREAGLADEVQMADDPRVAPQDDGTVVVDLRNLNDAKTQANIRTLLNHVEAENARTDWDDSRVMWEALPDSLKADWIELYVEAVAADGTSKEFNAQLERNQRQIENDFRQYEARKAGSDSTRGALAAPTARDTGTASRTRLVEGLSGDAGVLRADRARDAGNAGQEVTDVTPRFNRTRNVVSIGNIKDNAGKQVAVIESTREEMERTPHIKAAFDMLRANGLGNVVDSVESWYVTDNPVDWGGAYTVVNGKTAIVMSSYDMLVPSAGEYTMLHELGHAADKTHEDGGGLYSGMPEFNLRIVGDQIRAHGIVADQVIAFYESNPKSWFSKRMQYPLDRKAHGDLDAQGVREEMFAQLHATFNTPVGKEFLYDNLPDVAYFLENVNADIAQNDTTAEGLAGSTTAGAPSRFSQAKRGQEAQGPGVLATRPQGDRGQRASQVANIRFNRTTLPRAPKASQVQRAIAQLPKSAQTPVRLSLATLGNWVNKGLDRIVFTGDLISRAVTAGITSAKKLEKVLAERSNRVRELEYEVSRIADMYALVPESDRGDGPNSLNRFLFDSTRTGKWGYGEGADPEMAARFDALKPESKALAQAIFAHGAKVLADKKKMVLDYTASEYDLEIAYARENPETVSAAELEALLKGKEADLAKFKTLFALREGVPYAPIKRMGTYAVIAKSAQYRAAKEAGDAKELRRLEQDADHYHVTFVESSHEGRVLRERLLEDGFFGSDPNAIDLVERDKFSDDLYGGDTMLGALTKLRAKVDAKAASGDPAAAKMRSMVSELYLQALAEGSARKSEMRRRGIAGEVDMLRSFTTQGRADAQFMASVVANPKAQEAIQQMRQESRNGGDTTRKSELFNEIMARYLQTMEIDHSPIINKITRASSIWFLATSPGYYLQNLTQPWMMSLPAMAGRFGWGNASSALWKAYSELGPVMQGTRLFDQQFDFTKVPEDTRQAIVELAKRGRIDIGLETEMGEFKVEGDGAIKDRWNKIDKGMRLLVQKGEAVNRLSTGIAAYRLFMENNPNATLAQAVDYADHVLSDTHGNYDRFSAPRAFNSKLGRVMLQFRKFQLVQLTFYVKLINEAFTGKDRAMARKTLAYALAHTGVMAGVMGLPGYSAVAFVAGLLGSDEDEKYDLTYELRKMLGDGDFATMILRGAPTLAGVDLSGKVGSGNMLSLLPFSNADVTAPGGTAQLLGEAIGGSSVSLAARVLDGMGLILSGDWYKGIERTMPKGISDAMAAYRMANDGMTRRNGDVILPPEDVSAVEALFKAIGFTPADQSVVYERRDRAFQVENRLKERATRIKNDFIRATKANDTEARREALQAWNKLQEVRRRDGFKVQPVSELLKAPQAQAKRERDTVGGVQFNRSNRGFVEQM